MGLLLPGTRAPKHGLPTSCPLGLAIYHYLKLAGIPFNICDHPHPTSDKFPYLECDNFIEFEHDVIDKLKLSGLANLDYWVSTEFKEDIELGKLLMDMKLPVTTEDETRALMNTKNVVSMMASDAYHALSNMLEGKPFFLGDRPTSLDAYFVGHAIYVLHNFDDTTMKMLLEKHPNLVDHANKYAELGKPTNWLLETPREFQLYQIQYFLSKGLETLGSGSFGEVSKGWVVGFQVNSPGAMSIAIKISYKLRARDEERQYKNEISYLKKFSHPNIIKLLGYAQKGKQFFLVYELMQKGSLSQNLHAIDWKTTTKVALGSAEAMKYLHNRVPPIIFSDFKSANIVLDEDFNPKLTDFGIAEEEGKIVTGGTMGFTDSLTVFTGKRTKPTDMFSVGVLLLQLITKESNPLRDKSPQDWLNKWKQNELIVHKSLLESGCSMSSAEMLIRLALECMRTESEERPTIEEVIEKLEKI